MGKRQSKSQPMDFLQLDAGSEWANLTMPAILLRVGKLGGAREAAKKMSAHPVYHRNLLEASLLARHKAYAEKGALPHVLSQNPRKIRAPQFLRIARPDLLNPRPDGPTIRPTVHSQEAHMAGSRKVIDCRRFPAEKPCSIAIAGTEEEVLELAVLHASTVHGHQDTPELRQQIRSMLQDEGATTAQAA